MADTLNAHCLCNVIDRLAIGVVVLDSTRRVLFWNDWLANFGGLSSAEACGRPLAEIWPAAGGGRLGRAIEHAIRDGLPSLLSPALHGTLLPLYASPAARRQEQRLQQLCHVLPIREQDNPAACLIQISDVTANISRERLFRQQADTLRRTTTHDAVTGLPNHSLFRQKLAEEFQKAQRRSTPLGLVVADIDLFNDYNARLGRSQGDKALHAVAEACRRLIGPVGDQLARLSGNAFAFLLPGMSPAEAASFAARVRSEVAGAAIPYPGSPIGPCLTVSVGATVMRPDPEADTHTLMSSADVALYQAKQDGRDRAVYFSVEDGNFTPCS